MLNIKIIRIIPFLSRMWKLRPNKINHRFVAGTPVVVVDMKTSKSLEFSSISEAAKYFNTYPKTIWRIVYGNKLYYSRYKIMANDIKFKTFKKYKYICHIFIKNNYYIVVYITLLLIFLIILFIFVYKYIMVFKEIHGDYIYNVHGIRINKNKQILEYSFDKNSYLLYNNTLNTSNNKISRFIEVNKEWKFNANANLGIYKYIMNEINLDFSYTNNSLEINSIYPSPIIERIDLNNVFNTLVVKITPIVETVNNNNSLILNNNRNSLTLNTSIDLFQDKYQGKELLNYQSNILYLLINNLSPSIY